MSIESAEEIADTNEKVRVFKPKVILLSFHGTISPGDWEKSCLEDYTKKNMQNYLNQNWGTIAMKTLVDALRSQSNQHHFKEEDESVPLVLDDDDDDKDDKLLKQSVIDYINWQVSKKRESPQNYELQRLVWLEGYDSGKIKTPIFDDVLPALKSWHKQQIKLALYSAVSEQMCRKCLKFTSAGDITNYIDRYFDEKTYGQKILKESFKGIAKNLKVDAKDMLYITGFGQEAKIANQVEVKCVLIVREGNKTIRKYYLLNFNAINSLKDINLVDKKQ